MIIPYGETQGRGGGAGGGEGVSGVEQGKGRVMGLIYELFCPRNEAASYPDESRSAHGGAGRPVNGR